MEWYWDINDKKGGSMEIYIIIVLLIVVIGLLLLVNKELDLKHKELLNKIQILDNQIKNLWSRVVIADPLKGKLY